MTRGMKTAFGIAGLLLGATLVLTLWPPQPDPAQKPRPAPSAEWSDFTLSTPGGERVTLGDLVRKKPVLLTFWATWCPYCNAAIPRLKTIESGPLRDKMKLLAVDYLESPEKVAAFIRTKGIPYTVLLDRDGRVARSYRVLGVPTYILIDRSGRVAWRGYALPSDLDGYLR